MQILNHTPTVLSHGKLCEEPGYSKQRKKKVCTENFLPLVVPDIAGLVIVKSSRTATWRTCTRKVERDDRLRDLPEWLEEFTDNQEDTQMPAPAHISQDSDSERLRKWHQGYIIFETQFPKDRNCEVCLRTWMTRALCRRRTGEAVPRAEKFGIFITADHKVLNEEGESRNNHQYAVVVQDLATQRIQFYPWKNFSWDGKEFTKVSLAVRKAKSYSQRQFFGVWQILWRIFMESSNFHTSPFKNKWDCWASRTKSKRRTITCIAAVRIGWEMVVWSCGMLLLSAKRPRPPTGGENSLWKAIRRTI